MQLTRLWLAQEFTSALGAPPQWTAPRRAGTGQPRLTAQNYEARLFTVREPELSVTTSPASGELQLSAATEGD